MNKYPYETYEFYENPKQPIILRAVGFMKETIDPRALEQAAQKALGRYPYFAVKVIRKDEHYELIRNELPPVVYPLIGDRVYTLGREESNYHLLNIDYQDKTIGFNMAHAITGGRFFSHFFYTLLYEYIRLRYDAEAAPGDILPADSPMLPGENDYPDTDYYRETEAPVHTSLRDGYCPLGDPVFYNEDGSPKKPCFYRLSFPQKDVMEFSKKNDCSPNAFLGLMAAQAMDRILPPEAEPISACIMQNYSQNAGVPNSRYSLVNILNVVYPRSFLKRDYRFLGTLTRGQMLLQSDPMNSIHAMKREIARMDAIDNIASFEEKHTYATANNRFAQMPRFTYVISYPGQMDLGDLTRYMEGVSLLSAPFLYMTVVTFQAELQVTFQQQGTDLKYLSELMKSFEKAGVSCKVSGPFAFLKAGMELPT